VSKIGEELLFKLLSPTKKAGETRIRKKTVNKHVHIRERNMTEKFFSLLGLGLLFT